MQFHELAPMWDEHVAMILTMMAAHQGNEFLAPGGQTRSDCFIGMAFQWIYREVFHASRPTEDPYLHSFGGLSEQLSVEIEIVAMDLKTVHFSSCLAALVEAISDTLGQTGVRAGHVN
jgi:hypothetical protein